MGRGATDPNGTAAEALAAGISRRTAQRRRKANLGKTVELVPVGHGFAFPAKSRVEPRVAAAEASSIQGAIVARLKEAVEAGDASAIKIYTSAWVDACKCLKVMEDWARELDSEERRKAENAQIEKEMKAIGWGLP
jgi:hypothetical protein